jgi:hypothetical protein
VHPTAEPDLRAHVGGAQCPAQMAA